MTPIEARTVVAAAMKKGLIGTGPLSGGGGGKSQKHPPDLSEWIPPERGRGQALSVACRLCGAKKDEPCKRIGLPKEQAAHWARLLDEDLKRGLRGPGDLATM
jgi:hypothetical protein